MDKEKIDEVLGLEKVKQKEVSLDDLAKQEKGDLHSLDKGIAKNSANEKEVPTSDGKIYKLYQKKSKFFYLSLASSIIVILFLFSLYLSNLPKLYSLLIGVIAEAINCFLFYIYIVRKQMKSVGVIAMFILSTCFAILIISILLSTNV